MLQSGHMSWIFSVAEKIQDHRSEAPQVTQPATRSRPFATRGLSPPQWTSESIHRERFRLLKFETRHHSRLRQRVAVASEGAWLGEK